MQELYNKPIENDSTLKIEGILHEHHIPEQNYLSALKITIGKKVIYIHGYHACGAVIVNSKKSLDEIAKNIYSRRMLDVNAT